MLMFLIAIGRLTVVLGALLLMLMSTLAGWAYGSTLYFMSAGSGFSGSMSGAQSTCAVIGFFVGAILAGSIFGLAAAIFDIQRTLKMVVRGQGLLDDGWGSYVAPPVSGRREPRA